MQLNGKLTLTGTLGAEDLSATVSGAKVYLHLKNAGGEIDLTYDATKAKADIVFNDPAGQPGQCSGFWQTSGTIKVLNGGATFETSGFGENENYYFDGGTVDLSSSVSNVFTIKGQTDGTDTTAMLGTGNSQDVNNTTFKFRFDANGNHGKVDASTNVNVFLNNTDIIFLTGTAPAAPAGQYDMILGTAIQGNPVISLDTGFAGTWVENNTGTAITVKRTA
jgi:hypothetical protein